MDKSNLIKFIALEKIIQKIAFGKINLDFKIRGKRIVGVEVEGRQTTIYNQSEEDIQDNEKALKYVLFKVVDKLKEKGKAVLTFKIEKKDGQIKKIEFINNKTVLTI